VWIHSLHRFGETFARGFGSVLVHGIYATDSRKLSVRAAFPVYGMLRKEDQEASSAAFWFWDGDQKSRRKKYDLGAIYLIHRPSSGYPDPSTASGILGVAFDSCSLDAQEKDYYDKARIPT